ncbi:MAG: beta-ketoacyl-[acyl-carrier-protein] synthase family protein [Gammaproteobacteria bacterium]|nr:beta-ketoacyl-[acyl-carrier-protein] synthase family protein [Gammaproteobacteria bacterium]MCF6362453.1 beta-ketoacyl-[acyl-carrier-protein] synthase family protein [Gammaproteobacteria bacterium]
MTFGLIKPLQITDYTLTSALGAGRETHWQRLRNGRSGLTPCEFFQIGDLDTWVGQVASLDDITLNERWAVYDCRNNRLAQLALEQDGFTEAVRDATGRYGATRVSLFMGTSTSGIHQTEQAYLGIDPESEPLPQWYHYSTTHNTYAVADFVRRYLGLEGLSVTVSTACSSSAKVFASAYRAIQSGLCDAAVVGGVDTLCLTTLYGFNALQLVAAEKCRPFDVDRNGISIGEAGGFALLQPEKGQTGHALLGYGESSDAYHMSSPHPQGAGARAAMAAALARAGLEPRDIDYINLHGTGTPANDMAESRAVVSLFGGQTPCSSTKGWTGHTLGAAGIVEVALGLLCIEHGFMPCTLNSEILDPTVDADVLLEHRYQRLRTVLTNSFGFGGSNCSLVLGCSA